MNIDLKIAWLQANIKAKLEAIKLSNPLYYHKLKTEFNRLVKANKGTTGSLDYLSGLEGIMERLDDIVRGAD